jgi:pimeloyl-ACP methyl ester carboxylesterase
VPYDPRPDADLAWLSSQDSLGLEQAHVVGVSMGATIGFNMALQAPARVLSVFAMSPLLQVEVRRALLLALSIP